MKRAVLMFAAVALVTGLLALLPGAKPAEAAFPGKNGLIAFQSNRAGNNIFTIKPTGGAATQITFADGSGNPAFSPDGTKIAFKDRDNDIAVMNADGSNPTKLTRTGKAEITPTWSPDGTKIAFVANALDVGGGDDNEIWMINANGTGTPTNLTNNSYNDTDPAWSPNGLKIAFVSGRSDLGDTDTNIYVMDASGDNQTNITPNSPPGCSSNCYQGNDEDPTWSPNGLKIAYVHGYGPPDNPFAGGGKPNIWTMDPNGANKTNLSNTPSVSSTMPAWSPDGTKIAYVGATDTNRDIWMMNANGTSQGVLQANAANDISPDWQQDSIPPQTTITSGPSGFTRSTSAAFAFSSSEPGSTFECSLDGAAFAACSSPASYAGLANGQHTFSVRATDVAGNVDPTPAVRQWTVDTASPTGTVRINGGRASTTKLMVTLNLSASDAGSGVPAMRISNRAGALASTGWQPFVSSKRWRLLGGKSKTKTVYVQYRDGAGNVSAIALDRIKYRKR